eukprot:CAMPEP_0202977924 /NCGR_PEP_ID=MMETSP1396-20130829/84534_1 /ASSEMBLY_ACC=CAM_ASM_000872 /TAXON_ID= /ORGANISM="Pseudokeronopsis sp., Strain Brazil" /LENGTH=113 /DNA_ID=CAMNT_0049716755 /DNA_START=3615 /DNA_END=3953 /DNA_ORIENTATION=-
MQVRPGYIEVDDIQLNRLALKEMLEIICLKKTVETANGYECVQFMQKFYREKKCRLCMGVELVLMDIEMPVMDGYAALKQLLELMQIGLIPFRVPIVAITAFGDERDFCFKAG